MTDVSFGQKSITLSTIENVTYMTYDMSHIIFPIFYFRNLVPNEKIEMIQNENFNLFKTDLKPNYGQK